MKGINIEENSDGVQVSFNEESVEFDVNTLNLETLRTIEEGAVSAILSHLEEHIMCLPFIRMVLLSELEEGLDDKCDYIYNYADNMRKVNDCLNKFIQVSERGVERVINQEILNRFYVGVDEARHSYNEMSGLMYRLLPVYNTACKVEQFGLEDVSKERYLEVITGLNNKIAKNFEAVDKFAKQTTGCFVGDTNIYGSLAEIFKTLTKNMDIQYLEKSNQDKKVSYKHETIVPQKSQSEIEREFYINKANDLYDQLCIDWIRDLQKQVPHSSKDKYKTFMTKFNKFNETFEMPLVKTTSLGKAREVCSQINNLMNYISEISSGAYTTSPYNEK